MGRNKQRPQSRRSGDRPLPYGTSDFTNIPLDSQPNQPTPARGGVVNPALVHQPYSQFPLPSSEEDDDARSESPVMTQPEPRKWGLGGFQPRGQTSGIQGANAAEPDLDSIGHAMKSERQRRDEAEAKYGNPPAIQKTGSYAYPSPPPIVNRTAEDIEAGEGATKKKEGGGKALKIFLIVLVTLLIVGGIVGLVLGLTLGKKK